MPFRANCTPVGMAPVFPAAFMSPRAVTCDKIVPALCITSPSAVALTIPGQMYEQLHVPCHLLFTGLHMPHHVDWLTGLSFCCQKSL